ncbi:antirepressor [Pasteurellaceae bacterium Orientalotternb1]|nr:antirepressor [Pasteurellaceae bacterium Orientalotternb1]
MSQSTQLSAFNFENAAIRVITINNEPWFIAKDLCEALNLSNSRMALLALDDDEKGVSSTYTLGGEQELAIVSESGMYTLILRCRDAVKKGSVPHRFRKWVTAEVLPQIRKTGQYLQNNQRNLPLADVEQDEEALHIIVNLFHSLNGAYDMGEKLRTKAPHLARQIDNEIGGHYIYNLHMPTKQALEKARKFVHAKSERIMFVKGMLSLLEEPKRLVHTNF